MLPKGVGVKQSAPSTMTITARSSLFLSIFAVSSSGGGCSADEKSEVKKPQKIQMKPLAFIPYST